MLVVRSLTKPAKRKKTMLGREYIIRLRAPPGSTKKDVPRLRAFLKRIFRDFGFRCVTVEPATKPKEEK